MADPAAARRPTRHEAAAAEIRRIVEGPLDDCQRAIKAGTRSIALFELEDAAKRLKKIAGILSGG